MATRLISQITPNTEKWRAKVLVEEKANVYTSGNGHRLQKLILRDQEGDKVQGIIWNNDIEALQHTLLPCKTYYVGGANVRAIRPDFIAVANGVTTQWTIKPSAFILLVTEKEQEIPYPFLTMTSIEEIPPCIHNNTPVDLLAIAVEVHSIETKPGKSGPSELQEIIVIHQEMKPLLLTLWGDFIANQGTKLTALRQSMPVVLCKRLKASTHAVMSVATSAYTYIEVDPDIPQAKQLKKWADDNIDQIHEAMGTFATVELHPSLTYNPKQKIIPVAYIESTNKPSWVKVAIKFDHLEQDFHFICCSNCSYATSANKGERFECLMCRHVNNATVRCRVSAELIDESGSIKATFYEKNGEKLLDCPVTDICNMDEEQIHAMIIAAQAELQNKEFLAELKTSRQKYTHGMYKHTVLRWFRKETAPSLEGPSSLPALLPPSNEEINTPHPFTSGTSNKEDDKKTLTDDAATHTNDSQNQDGTTSETASSSDRTAVSPMKKMKLEGN